MQLGLRLIGEDFGKQDRACILDVPPKGIETPENCYGGKEREDRNSLAPPGHTGE